MVHALTLIYLILNGEGEQRRDSEELSNDPDQDPAQVQTTELRHLRIKTHHIWRVDLPSS